jgi:hypothetical protein
MSAPVEPADPLQAWATLVVKDGVGLGGLSQPALQQALALVWSALPAEGVLDERGINAALQAALAGPACCLRTDHVELRRWLVDAGWLQRDGYGREYRRVPWQALAPALRVLSEPLRGLAVADWVAAQRAVQAQRREARHRQWLTAQTQARPA